MKLFSLFLSFLAVVCPLDGAAQTGLEVPKRLAPVAKDSLLTGQSQAIIRKTLDGWSNKGLILNPLDALNGRHPGVNVSRGGDQRQAMLNSVRVRGTTSLTGGNDPLVVIDGVSSDIATLSTIYPADILSFKVLKNASETAQYG